MHKKYSNVICMCCIHGQNEESIKENTWKGVPWWFVLFNVLFSCLSDVSLPDPDPRYPVNTHVSIKVQRPADTTTRFTA